MPFINGNIDGNCRVELRGGPLGCERERVTDRQTETGGKESRREGRGEEEFSKGLTTRHLPLLD